MSKQKAKKNKCDELKANVKKLKKDWQNAETSEAKARKKYRKEYRKFKDLLVPFKVKWKKAKKKSDAHKKKYKNAKKKFKKDCQPTLMGEVMVVWKAPDSATNGVTKSKADNKPKPKEKTKKTAAKKKVKTTKAATTNATVKKTKKVEKKVTTPKPKVSTVLRATTPKPMSEKVIKPAEKKTTLVAKTAAQTPKKAATNSKKDNLKRIEGIGPKIEQLLHAAAIHTFKNLAEAPLEKLQEILTEAGPRFRMHKPDTWSRQAKIAAEGNWDELKTWQDKLKGGRE